MVGTRPSEIWAEQCAAAGIPYAPIPMRGEADLASAWALARLIRSHRIEIVHCQKGKARTLALLAGLVVKIPVLILNRGVSFPLDRWNRLGYTNRRVTAIVAVCESIKRGLVAAGVPAEKIEVIYSGTDLDRFHPGVDGSRIRAELRSPAGPPSHHPGRHSIVARQRRRARRHDPRAPHGAALPAAVRRGAPAADREHDGQAARAAASATSSSSSATATTSRRSSPPATSSSTPPTPAWA